MRAGRTTLQGVAETDAPPTVRLSFTKWGGHGHWTRTLSRMGEDEHGIWLAGPTGTRLSRPGFEYVVRYPTAVVIPRDEPWTAAFNAGADESVRSRYDVYVDITTPAVWSADGSEVTAVDLDLDVVRHWDGTVAVDDEDEFAEHQVRYGYPADIIALAERSCAERRTALAAGAEPFGSAYRPWLARVPGFTSH